MVCKSCNKQLINVSFGTTCPFCGAELEPERTAALRRVIAQLIASHGREILADSSRMVGLFAQAAPELETERVQLRIALDVGVGRLFLNENISHERCLAAVKQRLTGTLSAVDIEYMMRNISSALGWEADCCDNIDLLPAVSEAEVSAMEHSYMPKAKKAGDSRGNIRVSIPPRPDRKAKAAAAAVNTNNAAPAGSVRSANGNIRVSIPPRPDRKAKAAAAAVNTNNAAPAGSVRSANGNIRVSIPPRPDRKAKAPTAANIPSQPARTARPLNSGNGNIKVTIPPRAGRIGSPVTTGVPNRQSTAPRFERQYRDTRGYSYTQDTGKAERRELSFEELARRSDSVVMVAVCDNNGNVRGNGSGIAISEDGFILTNCHVVNRGGMLMARFENDDHPFPMQVIKYHTEHDMALLRVSRRLRPLKLYCGQKELVRGQKVVAIGSPMGLFNSFSDGIISGFRMVNGIQAIQFTAPISPGSSGGALMNVYGELIGMCFGGIENGQNLNLAISCRDIEPFVRNFIR